MRPAFIGRHSVNLMKNLGSIIALLLFLCACTDQEIDGQVTYKTVGDEMLSRPKPNLIILMADDLGFSDVGAFGGEIDTPNINALAESGVQMTDFYSSLTCAPSRAMLMAGTDNHLIGLGNMAETIADNQIGLAGYETYLNDRVVTLAEILKDRGYNTYMAGKWHLGIEKEQGPAANGFDESFSLLFGGGSHYANGFGPDRHRPKAYYRDNGKLLDKAPEGFFSSAYYTDRIIQNIRDNRNSGKPFFAFLGYTAPHWPLQFPPDYSGKYSETYKVGWQAIRKQRLAKLKARGIVDNTTKMAPATGDWEGLSAGQRAYSAKNMEIYASMVDDMDTHIGRLTTYLKDTGLYENTVIVFLSDNGADSWSNDQGPPAILDWANTFDNSYENAGQKDSFILYGKHWAGVSNTPLKDSKGNTSEGGIRVPMIVHLPQHIRTDSIPGISGVVAGIEDIMPTFLELAGADPEGANPKANQVPITGRSFLSALTKDQNQGDQSSLQARIIGRELWGKRGMRVGNWKLINQAPPTGINEWQLYNLKVDLAEQVDLASVQPEKLKEMLSLWQHYVDSNKVVLPEGKFRIREPGALPAE